MNITVKRTIWGWSAYLDEQGRRPAGSDGLIASSDKLEDLTSYLESQGWSYRVVKDPEGDR